MNIDLDPTQQKAATCEASAQLTLAGPGSGKTTTLVGRFAHLVRQASILGAFSLLLLPKKPPMR